MAPLSSSMTLKHVLRTPSAVANVLDWKKASGGAATAMAIDVHGDRINLALATLRSDKESADSFVAVPWGLWRRRQSPLDHNNNSNSNCYHGRSHDHYSVIYSTLESISLVANETAGEQLSATSSSISSSSSSSSSSPMATDAPDRRRRRKRAVHPFARRKLAGLVRDHGVAGFVVSWPVQPDTGLMGASCGRTLWAVEQLLLRDDDDDGDDYPPVFGPHRPLCLWSGGGTRRDDDPQQQRERDGDPLRTAARRFTTTPDAFGRSSSYARTSTKTEHRASKEQYYHYSRDESVSAAEIGRDFFEHHWPAAATQHPSMAHRHRTDDDSTAATATRTTMIRDERTTTTTTTTRAGSRYAGACIPDPGRTLIAV